MSRQGEGVLASLGTIDAFVVPGLLRSALDTWG
jgi:hypothetical protein